MLRNLQQSLVKLGQTEIWKYSDSTLPETLYRHHRIARTFGWLWIVSGGLMTSAMVEIMFSSNGWLRIISVVVGIASAAVTLLTIVPGIASGIWIDEIDRALIVRGLPVPTEKEEASIKRVRRGGIKMAYWFAVAVIGASLLNAGILGK